MDPLVSTVEVSVIIPNYNHGRFLEKRIESVINQTFKSLEIIILDDLSVDNSREVIERYRNHSAVSKIVYNDKNSGSTFIQWQKGAALATGKYLWFAESDDFSDSKFLEKCYALISSNEKIGMVFCDSTIVNEVGNVEGEWRYNPNCPDIYNVFKGRDFCFDKLIYQNIIPNASSVIFLKKLVLENKHWINSELRNCGDWELWIHISQNYDVGYIKDSLNFFRRHSHNVTNSLLLIRLESISIVKKIIRSTIDTAEISKLFNSLFAWCFYPAPWIKTFHFNHSNIRYYFKNNLSFRSIRQLIINLSREKLKSDG